MSYAMVKRPVKSLLYLVMLNLIAGTAAAQSTAAAKDAAAKDVAILETVKVRADGLGEATENSDSYTTDASKTATGLTLSLRDTPQSVSVITHERIEDQALKTVGDALRNTAGVSVKAVDRGRNGLSVRGFEVSSFQFDGMPIATNNVGIETGNTAIYDRVEVVRGATGLLNGTGDPSAAVNLVRKHADSKTFSGNIDLELGSWSHRAGTLDLTTPITADGSVRARALVSLSAQDAFIDLEHTKNSVFYGVVDADLSASTKLSLGASHLSDKRKGVYWGGLPLWYKDGSRTDLPRSATTATRWNQWDTEEKNVFASVEHKFANDWSVRANASYYQQYEYSNLLWLTGQPDKVTGLGMNAYPYLYGSNPKQTQWGVLASGPFRLLNRQHELTLGVIHSESEGGWDNGGAPLVPGAPMGNFNLWDGSYAAPVWGTPYVGSRNSISETAAYTAARLQITDSFKVIAGARLSNWKQNVEAAAWNPLAYEIVQNHQVTPYAGLVYDLSEQISTYLSYSDIFKPQSLRTLDGGYLDPLVGKNYELGVKGEFFDGGLNASAAVFRIEQDNFAVSDGPVAPGQIPTFSGAKGVEVEGYEMELVGKLREGWDINLSWTQYSAERPDKKLVAEEHPRKLIKLFSKYQLQGAWSGFSFGGGVNWESEPPKLVTNPASGLQEKSGAQAHALVDLMAGYEFNKTLSLQLNIKNALDKEYQESSWGTYTYGEPRSALLNLDYKF